MKKKILIVEDEPVLLDALVDTFTHEQYDVLTARDGEAGLNIALQSHPDCILLDIIMPIMDGTHMLQVLRKDPWGEKVHVIILTNVANPQVESDSVLQGAGEYLIKTDWKLEDIVKKVKQKIGDCV